MSAEHHKNSDWFSQSVYHLLYSIHEELLLSKVSLLQLSLEILSFEFGQASVNSSLKIAEWSTDTMSPQVPASALEDPASLQQPAIAPPPGVTPNFAHPEDKGPTLVIVATVLLALVIIALANRAYTKLYIIRKSSWDDLTMSLSALGVITIYIICILGEGAYSSNLSSSAHKQIYPRGSRWRDRKTSI